MWKPAAISDKFSQILEVMIYEVVLYFCSFSFSFCFLWCRLKNCIFCIVAILHFLSSVAFNPNLSLWVTFYSCSLVFQSCLIVFWWFSLVFYLCSLVFYSRSFVACLCSLVSCLFLIVFYLYSLVLEHEWVQVEHESTLIEPN